MKSFCLLLLGFAIGCYGAPPAIGEGVELPRVDPPLGTSDSTTTEFVLPPLGPTYPPIPIGEGVEVIDPNTWEKQRSYRKLQPIFGDFGNFLQDHDTRFGF